MMDSICLNLNLNGLLVIRHIDNTSPGGAPGGKLVPCTVPVHFRFSQPLYFVDFVTLFDNKIPGVIVRNSYAGNIVT